MVLENWTDTWEKKDYFLTPYTRINSKWINNLNVRPPNHKTPKRKYRQVNSLTLFLVIFLDISPPTRETKEKINKWDYNKFKSSCAAKKTINKTKRQPTEREKIFANDTSDKRLISKMYKELIQLNIKNLTTQ